MSIDPLYNQIRLGLSNLTDGQLFERCAVDLLQTTYPTISSREGGDDAGLDGLVTEADGNSIQLICTIGKDVRRNVKKSISANLSDLRKTRACILATSRELSNKQKRSLEGLCLSLGRPLIHICDQAEITRRIYHNSSWLKNLLRLTGHPHALSEFPITNRMLSEDAPIGRQEILTRIIDSTSDLVVVGQPGYGKTHLLFHAARQANGRFVIDDEDRGRLAGAIRDVSPNFIIVDDAGSRVKFVQGLVHLRTEIRADFKIIAACWPGEEENIERALRVPSHKILVLKPLSASQILEIINSFKIVGPSELLKEIIHQADGNPGLAATLCAMCWQAQIKDLVLGTALVANVKLTIEPRVGKDARFLLACFALGGETGMTLDAVAKVSGKPSLEIVRISEELAPAGILDVQNGLIKVKPARLRQALVRDTFLRKEKLNLSPFLAEVPDQCAATEVLIQAKKLGGFLADDFLQSRLQNPATLSIEVLKQYATLGKAEATWGLKNFPQMLRPIASEVLETIPEEAIPQLLDHAKSALSACDPGRKETKSQTVLKEIRVWILGSNQDENDAFTRRQIAAQSLAKWFREGEEEYRLSVQLSSLILSIKTEFVEYPPAEEYKLVFRHGLVPQDQLGKIRSLFGLVLPILKQVDICWGREVQNIFHTWMYPNFGNPHISTDYVREARHYVREMICELLEVYKGKWTFHHHLERFARELGVAERIQIGRNASILYPLSDLVDPEGAELRNKPLLDQLSEEWAQREPSFVAKELHTLQQDAARAQLQFRWDDHKVCVLIARRRVDLNGWIAAFVNCEVPQHLLAPFVEELSQTIPSDADSWVSYCLNTDRYLAIGVDLTLRYYPPKTHIWNQAELLFPRALGQLSQTVLRHKLFDETINALLVAGEPVAAETAVNLWARSKEDALRPENFGPWTKNIIQHVDDNYVLEEIFTKIPDVAFEWLKHRINRTLEIDLHYSMTYGRPVKSAICGISVAQRMELLELIEPELCSTELIRLLVGEELEVFERLLTLGRLCEFKLTPLRLKFGERNREGVVENPMNDAWIKLAVAALQKGYSEEEVFAATCLQIFRESGLKDEHLDFKLAAFNRLAGSSDLRVRKIGELGLQKLSV